MVVEPTPRVHVDKRDTHDFVATPENVESFETLFGVAAVLIAEEIEVARLEDEGQRLGEGGVGHAFHDVVVDIVEGDGLLYIVAELMDGNVVAFVIHAVVANTGAKTGIVGAHVAFPCVAGTAGGVDCDVGADEVNLVGSKAETTEDGRHAFGGESFFVGIETAGFCREFVFVDGAAAFETIVPDVEGFQFAA